jgi:hypothetical protein
MINRLGLVGLAVQYVPRIVQIRRRTWIALGVGLLLLFGLAIAAVLALIVWFIGQAQGFAGNAQELLADPVSGVIQQVEQLLSTAREQLDGFLGGLWGGLLPAEEEAGSVNNSEEAEK